MKKQFSWYPFDLDFLKSVVYSEKTPKSMRPKFEAADKEQLMPYMDRICARPDEHFVRRYHHEIVENFLAGSTHLVTVMRGLERVHYRGVQVGSLDSMLEKIRTLNMTSTVMQFIIAELYLTGSRRIADDQEISIFTTPKVIDVANCIPGEIDLFAYQEDAITALQKHFVTDDKDNGLLVMPTGSGKTRVAVRFLIDSMIAKGWQVLFLAHRSMLLDQAASTFYAHAGAVLKHADPDRKQFKMVCVSGMHATVKATEPDDDVMICSVQSLVRNLPYLQAVLGDKVMIVVDEAHHLVAPSYRLILREVRKISKNVKLLGLTATPVRMSDEGTAKLMALFDNNVVYSAAMSELIAKEYLSKPAFERVDTNIDFTTSLTEAERRYIEKWGELSPETLDRLANIKERNMLIADTYMKNRERYGKTLIFALNATHCISLCEELQKRGVRCDYIYCAHEGNDSKIKRFRNGELDVLVNIQILTEGSDIPNIDSVFLCRPTQSDVLLMQMIGRGMRGKYAGGTESVNIVCFNDIWDRYTRWLDPRFVIEGEYEEELPGETAAAAREAAEMIDWSIIREIMDGISVRYAQAGSLHMYSVLPVGWYDVFDEDGAERKLLVFSSQLAGYKTMLGHRAETLDNKSYTGAAAACDWFTGFGPQPDAEDLQMLLDTYRMTDEYPHLHQIKDRDKIDASLIAANLKKENVGIADIDGRIEAVYEENTRLIDSLYGGLEAYSEKVYAFLHYPNGIKPFGARIEEIPEESLTLDRTPVYDLDALTAQVVDEMFDGAYGELPPIFWTKKPVETYYGQYTYGKNGDHIVINSILNSPDVPVETVKYVVYHELLHRDHRYHDKTFRAEEHKYPNWTQHERFLDHTFPKFDSRYGM